MKKIFLKSFICISFIFSIWILFNCTLAEEVIMDYKNVSNKLDKNDVVFVGEEFWVNINLKDILSTDSLSLFANLEYDKDVFEIVKSQKDGNMAEVIIGEKWIEAHCEVSDGKIVAHTQNIGNVDHIMSIKFKVKNKVKAANSNIYLKNISLRRNYIRNINLNKKEVTLNLNIAKKLSGFQRCLLIILLVVLIIGFPVGLIILLNKLGKFKTKDKKNDEIKSKKNYNKKDS